MLHRSALLLLAVACTTFALNSKECSFPGIRRGSSPRKFGVCVENDGKLQYVENECSEGMVFDALRKSCRKILPRALMMFQQVQDYSTQRQDYNWTAGGSTWLTTTTPRPTTAAPIPANQPCKGPGAYCSNCNTLSFCVKYNSAGVLKTVLDLSCNADSLCVTQQGCVKKIDGGLCREGKFVCGDVGLYPDLYDCKVFHSCTVGQSGELIDTPITCSGGLIGNRWNPVTSTCGWSENDESCRKSPVPLCSKPLEMRAVGGQIYSICMVDAQLHTLSPRLFRCPRDSMFNATAYSCV